MRQLHENASPYPFASILPREDTTAPCQYSTTSSVSPTHSLPTPTTAPRCSESCAWRGRKKYASCAKSTRWRRRRSGEWRETRRERRLGIRSWRLWVQRSRESFWRGRGRREIRSRRKGWRGRRDFKTWGCGGWSCIDNLNSGSRQLLSECATHLLFSSFSYKYGGQTERRRNRLGGGVFIPYILSGSEAGENMKWGDNTCFLSSEHGHR